MWLDAVTLSVNTITPEPLEISSRSFHGIIIWSKGRPSSKMVIHRGARVVRNVSGVPVEVTHRLRESNPPKVPNSKETIARAKILYNSGTRFRTSGYIL